MSPARPGVVAQALRPGVEIPKPTSRWFPFRPQLPRPSSPLEVANLLFHHLMAPQVRLSIGPVHRGLSLHHRGCQRCNGRLL